MATVLQHTVLVTISDATDLVIDRDLNEVE